MLPLSSLAIYSTIACLGGEDGEIGCSVGRWRPWMLWGLEGLPLRCTQVVHTYDSKELCGNMLYFGTMIAYCSSFG